MRSVLLFLLLGVATVINGQVKYPPGTQGYAEDQLIRKTFTETKERKEYARYRGHIVTSEDQNKIQYDSATVSLPDTPAEFRAIFSQGLFYPLLIAKNQTGQASIITPLPDSLAKDLFNHFGRLQYLSIGAFQEIKSENLSPSIKRFSFYLWQKGFANPSLYIFELENITANKSAGTAEFINGAKLTLFQFLTILM
jgi:hypothetical protein